MNIFYIVVCVILVGCLIMPLLLFNASGRRVQKKMRNDIKQIVAKHHLNISETEQWGNSYLGLDAHQKKLVFLKTITSELQLQLLDLNTISYCQLIDKRKLVNIRHKKELILEHLDLEFLSWSGESISINFYDENDGRMEDYEQARAEKWKTLINGCISKIPIEKKAA